MVKPTLLILAAGLGSRYGSLKQIEPIGPSGEAIIDYSVYDAIKAGFGKVVFVIKKDIEEDFRESLLRRFENRIETSWVFQELDMLPGGFEVPHDRKKPWGTAHAILMAEQEISTPFAAINADDFYGFEAFSGLVTTLSGKKKEADYCMIGYKLKNTLSEHGTVSRGVCDIDEEGFLRSVSELTRIKREDGRIIYYEGDKVITLDEDATVSMNMWGFTTTIFEQIRSRFTGFLNENMNNPAAEFYIPTLVDQLIREKAARVNVISCDATWFGITYRDDRDAARKSILHKIEKGEYPGKLWR